MIWNSMNKIAWKICPFSDSNVATTDNFGFCQNWMQSLTFEDIFMPFYLIDWLIDFVILTMSHLLNHLNTQNHKEWIGEPRQKRRREVKREEKFEVKQK